MLEMLSLILSISLLNVVISVLIELTLFVSDIAFASNLLMLFLFSSMPDRFFLTASSVVDKSDISFLIGSKLTESIFISDIVFVSSRISDFIADISFLFSLTAFDKLMLILLSLSFRLLTSTFILLAAFSTDVILSEITFKESSSPVPTVIFFISDWIPAMSSKICISSVFNAATSCFKFLISFVAEICFVLISETLFDSPLKSSSLLDKDVFISDIDLDISFICFVVVSYFFLMSDLIPDISFDKSSV